MGNHPPVDDGVGWRSALTSTACAPGGTRTPSLRVRSPLLYPVELRALSDKYAARPAATGRSERETGIEPAWLAWKARALPLSYSRGSPSVTSPSGRDREEAPAIGHAFELVLAALLEDDPRARDDALHRLRHEHFARSGQMPDA
jgi:hypothetical protein